MAQKDCERYETTSLERDLSAEQQITNQKTLSFYASLPTQTQSKNSTYHGPIDV